MNIWRISAVFMLLAVTFVSAQSLKNTDNSSDYLVITASRFVPDVQQYVQWRSAPAPTHPALRSRIVTLEDINREFGDSTRPQVQAEAIRSFVSYALQSWRKPAPRYVVLVGSTNIVPSYRIKVGIPLLQQQPYINYEDSIPLDEWYVVNRHIADFNNRPQAAIGRIPGRTSAEIQRVLRKIRTFEEQGNSLGYDSTLFTTLLDAQDVTMFDEATYLFFEFLRYRIPRPVSNRSLDYSKLLGRADAKTEVFRGINSGSPLVMYYGHGAPAQWSRYSIVVTDDIGNRLARQNRPFILSTAGCSQNFDLPRTPSIVEAAMLLDSGGAVATVASSGYSSLPENNFFQKFFYRFLLSSPGMDIGTAMLKAKTEAFEGGLAEQDTFARRMTLLGDPALVPFRRLITSVADAPANNPQQALLSDIAPNPASGQATIRMFLERSEALQIDIVNLRGERLITQHLQGQRGENTFALDLTGFANGIYAYRVSGTSITTAKFFSVLR